MRGKEWRKQYLYICLFHNICCVLIEIHCVDFDQLQTRHYKQRDERSWKTISIAENEIEENCIVEKAF